MTTPKRMQTDVLVAGLALKEGYDTFIANPRKKREQQQRHDQLSQQMRAQHQDVVDNQQIIHDAVHQVGNTLGSGIDALNSNQQRASVAVQQQLGEIQDLLLLTEEDKQQRKKQRLEEERLAQIRLAEEQKLQAERDAVAREKQAERDALARKRQAKLERRQAREATIQAEALATKGQERKAREQQALAFFGVDSYDQLAVKQVPHYAAMLKAIGSGEDWQSVAMPHTPSKTGAVFRKVFTWLVAMPAFAVAGVLMLAAVLN